jgi:hypothetical protein
MTSAEAGGLVWIVYYAGCVNSGDAFLDHKYPYSCAELDLILFFRHCFIT